MTIIEARKVLGKLGANMSDTDVLFEIENATLLKDMFFKYYIEGMQNKNKHSFKERHNQ